MSDLERDNYTHIIEICGDSSGSEFFTLLLADSRKQYGHHAEGMGW